MKERFEDIEPLTIPEMKAADADFEDFTVEKVEHGKDGWVYVTYDKCIGFGIDRKEHPCNIFEGDRMRRYPRGFGETYGIDVNGVELYWMTPKERDARRAASLAKLDRDKREQYERDREKNEATVAALPEPLRKRIERFRLDRPDEERLWEGYEIFCCQQAAVIANICRREMPGLEPSAAIEWFRALPYHLQKKMGLDDGHSGNTFGGACMLAQRVMMGLEV